MRRVSYHHVILTTTKANLQASTRSASSQSNHFIWVTVCILPWRRILHCHLLPPDLVPGDSRRQRNAVWHRQHSFDSCSSPRQSRGRLRHYHHWILHALYVYLFDHDANRCWHADNLYCSHANTGMDRIPNHLRHWSWVRLPASHYRRTSSAPVGRHTFRDHGRIVLPTPRWSAYGFGGPERLY